MTTSKLNFWYFFAMKYDFSQRVRVGVLKDLGYSQAVVAQMMNVTKSFVKRWWTNRNYGPNERHRIPYKVTRSVSKNIIRKLQQPKRQSLRTVAKATHLSYSSVQQVAKKSGLFPYHRAKSLILTANQKKSRFQFAKDYKDFDFRQALFIDEKIAFLIPKPNHKNDIIWAPKGTTVLPAPYDRHSAKINVAAGIAFDLKSKIYLFEETLDSDIFIEIAKSTFIPAGKKIEGGHWALIMDGDPKHTSRKTTEFFAQNGVQVIKLPAKSPELNAIENIWSVFAHNLEEMRPNSKAAMKKAIPKAWDKVTMEAIQNTIDSIPHRLQLVGSSKGDHIKYH